MNGCGEIVQGSFVLSHLEECPPSVSKGLAVFRVAVNGFIQTFKHSVEQFVRVVGRLVLLDSG